MFMKNHLNLASKFRKKAGQNTAEYLIMLVLISVGSIGVFSVFGGTIRNQVSSVVAAFGGKSTEYQKSQDLATSGAGKAEAMAKKDLNMSGVAKEEIEGFKGTAN